MEFKKIDLINLIKESSEMEEMAYIPKGTQAQRTDPETGKVIIPKAKPYWKEDNNTDTPNYWLINPTQEEGKTRLIVPLDCDELMSFLEENSDWLDSIGVIHELQPELVKCKRGKYAPRNIPVGTSYVHSGKKQPIQTALRRELYPIIEKVLNSEDTKKRLEKLSIPQISVNDPKALNRFAKANNEEITYQTHSFESYYSSKQFLQAVTARISNKPIPEGIKAYNLARQYRNILKTWDEKTKNRKEYFGKTEKYKLEKHGLDPDNLDVTVRTDLSIFGKNFGTNYRWTIKFETKFGRKLQEERYMASALKTDKSVTLTKEIDLKEDVEFTDDFTVLDYAPIREGLFELLVELKNKFFSEMKPIETLKLANIRAFDVTKEVTQQN